MAYETCKKHDGVYEEILFCPECRVKSSEYWANYVSERIKEEKEKLLDAMQAVCDKEENEGGRMLIEQFREL